MIATLCQLLEALRDLHRRLAALERQGGPFAAAAFREDTARCIGLCLEAMDQTSEQQGGRDDTPAS